MITKAMEKEGGREAEAVAEAEASLPRECPLRLLRPLLLPQDWVEGDLAPEWSSKKRSRAQRSRRRTSPRSWCVLWKMWTRTWISKEWPSWALPRELNVPMLCFVPTTIWVSPYSTRVYGHWMIMRVKLSRAELILPCVHVFEWWI